MEKIKPEEIIQILAKGIGYDIKKHYEPTQQKEIDLTKYEKMNLEELNAEVDKIEAKETELKARDEEMRRQLGLFIQKENPMEFRPIFEGNIVVQDRVIVQNEEYGCLNILRDKLKSKITEIKRAKLIKAFEGAHPGFKGIINRFELETGARTVLWVKIDKQ